MKSFGELRQDSNTLGFEFLLLDIQTAGTFLDLARTTRNEETRSRNLDNAAKAYAAVLRLEPGVTMTSSQKAELASGMEALRARLEASDPTWTSEP